MNVLIINASARIGGNTDTVIDRVISLLDKESLTYEVIEIGNELFKGCIGCQHCWAQGNTSQDCVFKDDRVNEISSKFIEADAIVIGSPVYYGGITGTLKNLLDRVFYSKMGLIQSKIVLPFVVQRRDGGMDALRSIENYFSLSQSYFVPTRYWSILHGREKGEVVQDEEGLYNIEYSTQVMINMIKEKISSTNQEYEQRMTNFVK